jgi:hypothetical protein
MTVSQYLTPISKPQSSELIIYPYQGVGQIRFGMTREKVRSLLGEPSATFYKGLNTQSPTDAYDNIGVHISYHHPSGYCEALEFFEPAQLLLEKKQLFKISFARLRDWLASQDHELEIDEEGLTCFKYGLGIYAPDWQEDSTLPAQGVLVFNDRNYYNQ